MEGIRDYDPRFINLKSFQQIVSLSGASFAITLSIALLFQGSVILVTYSIGLEATAIFTLNYSQFTVLQLRSFKFSQRS